MFKESVGCVKSKDVKNIIYNSIKTCLSIIFPLITFPYVTRALKVDNIGKINFSLSIVSYFSLIASLGIPTYAIRECSKEKNNYKRLSVLASEIFSINVFTSIVSLTILYILIFTNDILNKYSLLIMINSITIVTTTLATDWINTAMEDFKFLTLRSFYFQLLSIILILVFVHNENDYIIYSFIHVLSGILICVSNIFYRRKYCEIKFTLSLNIKKHLKPVLFLFFTLLSQSIFSNCDITMIGLQLGDRYVGLYSTAHKLINIIFMVVASICWVMLPQLSLLFKNADYKEINKLLYQIVAFTISLSLPIVIGINLIPEEILMIIGGIGFTDATICLQILSVSMFISFFIGIVGNMILIPSGNDVLYMKSTLITMVANILLNYILIPYFGINGAATATALSQAIELLVVILYVDTNIEICDVHNLIKAPLIGVGLIFILKYIIFYFTNDFYFRATSLIVLSILLYFTVLVKMKNEFAINFIIPILKKFGIYIN